MSRDTVDLIVIVLCLIAFVAMLVTMMLSANPSGLLSG